MTNETKWSIDQAHSEISFKVRHLMISNVKGTFKTFDASIYTVAQNFKTAVVDLWIDVSSISTGDAKRDEHLKSADFFDVKNHKQIAFSSNTIGDPDKDGNHELWGELTMRGISKLIKLNIHYGGTIRDPWGNEKAGFTVSGKINRSEWGLIWNTSVGKGGLMVSDEVIISCELELTNAGQKDMVLNLDGRGDHKAIL